MEGARLGPFKHSCRPAWKPLGLSVPTNCCGCTVIQDRNQKTRGVPVRWSFEVVQSRMCGNEVGGGESKACGRGGNIRRPGEAPWMNALSPLVSIKPESVFYHATFQSSGGQRIT